MRHPLQSSLFNLHYFYSRDVALGDFQPHFLRVTFDFINSLASSHLQLSFPNMINFLKELLSEVDRFQFGIEVNLEQISRVTNVFYAMQVG